MTLKVTHSDVSRITKCPKSAIDNDYPIIMKFMREYGLTSDAAHIAMLATVPPETAHTFKPIKELGGPEYLRRNYDVTGKDPERARKMLNTEPGDGIKYCGKGYTQTTWKLNHIKLRPHFKRFGIPGDPVENPNMLLTPVPAAIALASYFAEHGTVTWAEKALATNVPSCRKCAVHFDNHRKKKAKDRPLPPAHECSCVYCRNNGAKWKTENGRPDIKANICKECSWKTVRRTVNGGLHSYDEFKRIVNELVPLIVI